MGGLGRQGQRVGTTLDLPNYRYGSEPIDQRDSSQDAGDTEAGGIQRLDQGGHFRRRSEGDPQHTDPEGLRLSPGLESRQFSKEQLSGSYPRGVASGKYQSTRGGGMA